MPMHQAQTSTKLLCRVDVARKEATTILTPGDHGVLRHHLVPMVTPKKVPDVWTFSRSRG